MSNERLRPADLAVDIPRVFRGYETRKVDELLARAASEIGALSGQLKAAQEEAVALRAEIEGFRQQESAIKEALIAAQRSAEATRAESQRAAERLIEEARQRALELQRDLQTRVTELRFELEKLNLEKQRFLGQFRAMLEHYLATVVEAGSTLGMPSSDSPNGHPLTVADSMSGQAPTPSSEQLAAADEVPEAPVPESESTKQEF